MRTKPFFLDLGCSAVSLALALALAVPAVADSPPAFVKMWGTQGAGQGQFNQPFAVVLAPDGLLYIADQLNERVVVYTRDGNQVSEFPVPGPGLGQPPDPTGIAYNPSNNLLYVSEHHTHRISVFTMAGTYLFSFSNGVLYPVDLRCDASGSVFVASSGNDRVMEFAADGSFIQSWPVDGTPYGLLLGPGGTVYVTGFYNNQVRKYTSTGTVLLSWGSYGTGDGEFHNPEGMWADTEGHLYVGDSGNHRVQKFTLDGTFLTKWGTLGTGPGEFCGSNELVGDNEGNIYVAEWCNNRMQKFSYAPTPVSSTSWGGLKARYRLGAATQGK